MGMIIGRFLVLVRHNGAFGGDVGEIGVAFSFLCHRSRSDKCCSRSCSPLQLKEGHI